jgi:hypothetical protein
MVKQLLLIHYGIRIKHMRKENKVIAINNILQYLMAYAELNA